jgi:hypothetical protein
MLLLGISDTASNIIYLEENINLERKKKKIFRRGHVVLGHALYKGHNFFKSTNIRFMDFKRHRI